MGLFLSAALRCGSSSDEIGDEKYAGESRQLDEMCGQSPTCLLSGSARLTSGITADATAIRMGPNAGSVALFMLDKPVEGTGNKAIEVLARGLGNIETQIPGFNNSFPLGNDYQ